jgi:hypothetical protein
VNELLFSVFFLFMNILTPVLLVFNATNNVAINKERNIVSATNTVCVYTWNMRIIVISLSLRVLKKGYTLKTHARSRVDYYYCYCEVRGNPKNWIETLETGNQKH